MGTKLYVGNLSYDSQEEDLKSLFQQAGEVAKCDIVVDKFTGQSRGFAFVEMANQEGATKAIEMLDGKEFDGRNLKVNEARPREERPSREFGAGNGGGRGMRRPYAAGASRGGGRGGYGDREG